MSRRQRIAWDTGCFLSFLSRRTQDTEAVRTAVKETMGKMQRGEICIVASKVIETEVRPGNLEATRRFHATLQASPYFESYDEAPAIRRLALQLQDRLQSAGCTGTYADTIHVATAIAARAAEFWTLDSRIPAWQPHVPEVKLCAPYLLQGVLPD